MKLWRGVNPVAALALLATFATACTSTRQLASSTDPRLFVGDHALGYVVKTTEAWHARIDPNTTMRFQNHAGEWTAPTPARNLYVDQAGVWTDRSGDDAPMGRKTRVGWHWDDVQNVEVENLSGGKTLGAIVGYTALAVALLPLALLMRGGPSFSGGGPHLAGGGAVGAGGHGSSGGGGGAVAATLSLGASGGDRTTTETWAPAFAEHAELDARPMFTLGQRVRAIALPTVALDTSMGTRGDLVTTGAVARIRLGGVFEIGGGVRSAEVRAPTGWTQSVTGVFQIGLHLPLDAGLRIAIPVGFEVGGGGAVATDLRFPWGLRYTSATGRWFATATPASPSYLRLHNEPGRFGYVSSVELGRAF